jgi:hypothetical protein
MPRHNIYWPTLYKNAPKVRSCYFPQPLNINVTVHTLIQLPVQARYCAIAQTGALFARAGKLKLRQAKTCKNAYGNNNITQYPLTEHVNNNTVNKKYGN